MKISPAARLRGELTLPGDKSISHRAVMFGALAEGTTAITGFLSGADCLSTIRCFRALGVSIEETPEQILVHGRGLNGLRAPCETLYTGNSGTTTRLLCGILAGRPFESVLDGDASIRRRPMKRVILPLAEMGAQILSEQGCAPLRIQGRKLHGIHYQLPVASAQLKSAILLAGLSAEGETSICEPAPSRDHTERMLRAFGADLTSAPGRASVRPSALHAVPVSVPGDISSAAFFLVAGLIVPNSEIVLKNVGINETRAGILTVLQAMGGDIRIENRRLAGDEPVADLVVRSSSLHGIEVSGRIIPALIDEIPAICVAALFAEGETVIRDAAELRVKETDRIAVVAEEFAKCGADLTPTEDGMVIRGGAPLHRARMDARTDHRIAMCEAVIGLVTGCEIKGAACADVSYPSFFEDLKTLTE